MVHYPHNAIYPNSRLHVGTLRKRDGPEELGFSDRAEQEEMIVTRC
jgi:hypothetical protein